MRVLSGDFKSIMRVSGEKLTMRPRMGINDKGNLFWFIVYNIVIKFGLAEMKAYYTWEEDVSLNQFRVHFVLNSFAGC
jgi:hypothetical protein